MTVIIQTNSSSTQERIFASASELFARHGFNGVSTRDIAAKAAVNEVTIYRHFHSKRDLYYAVLESELCKINLRGDLLADVAEARDGHSALERMFGLIDTVLTREPNVLRLVQYSALEGNEDIDRLLREHLKELVGVLARYLQPWIDNGELQCPSAGSLVLSLAVIAFGHRSFRRLFSGEAAGPEAISNAYVNLYGREPLSERA